MGAQMNFRRLAAAALVAFSMVSTAHAGDHWKFKVINKSDTAATEFRTKENGDWSDNWISARIEPGDTFNMDFGHSDGDCSVRTQIHFVDGTYFDANVDYCNASKLYIYEKKLTWE
eukprot:gene12281-12367_t